MNRITTYPKGCEFCGATGFVSNRNPHPEVTTSLTNTCPVCNGGGVIIATESYFDGYEKEFLIWILTGGDGYWVQSHMTNKGEIIFKTDEVTAFQEEKTLDELYEYWQKEVK